MLYTFCGWLGGGGVNVKDDFFYVRIGANTYKILLIAEWEWPVSYSSQVYTILVPKFLFPLNAISYCASAYLTIAIAYER